MGVVRIARGEAGADVHAGAEGVARAGKVALRLHHVAQLLVADREVALPLGVVRIARGEVGGDGHAGAEGVAGAGEVALRLHHVAQPVVADREVALPFRVVRIAGGEAGADVHAGAEGVAGASEVALRLYHLAQLVVADREVALRVRIVWVRCRAPLADGEIILVRRARPGEVPERQEQVAVVPSRPLRPPIAFRSQRGGKMAEGAQPGKSLRPGKGGAESSHDGHDPCGEPVPVTAGRHPVARRRFGQARQLQRQFGQGEAVRLPLCRIVQPAPQIFPQRPGQTQRAGGGVDEIRAAGLGAGGQPVAQAFVERRHRFAAPLQMAAEGFQERLAGILVPALHPRQQDQRHRLFGGAQHRQRRGQFGAIPRDVGEHMAEAAQEHPHQPARQAGRRGEVAQAGGGVLQHLTDIEEIAIGGGHHRLRPRLVLAVRRQPVAHVGAQIVLVLGGGAVQVQRAEAGELAFDFRLRPAGDQQGDPGRQVGRAVVQQLGENAAAVVAQRFVQCIDDDEETVVAPAAVDTAMQQLHQQRVEQIGGGQRGQGVPRGGATLQPVQQQAAVIGQAGGDLEGQCAHHLRRLVPQRQIVSAQVQRHHVGAAVMGHPGGEGALAQPGLAVNGGAPPRLRRLAPRIHPVAQPHPADEALQQARHVGVLGGGLQQRLQPGNLAGETLCFRRRQPGQQAVEQRPVPRLPHRPAFLVVGGPVRHVEPLDVAD